MQLCDLPVHEITLLLRQRQIAAVEILDSALERIAAVDGRPGVLDPGPQTEEDARQVHAFITLTAERARTRAEAVDRQLAAGEDPGLLAGVPVTIKDIFCLEGTLSTAASRILSNFTAPYTATPVARLEAAGAVVLGKVNLDEFTYGSSTDTYHVVVDARIREDPGSGSLVFASGSTLTVDWTGPSSAEVFNCPTSGHWKTSVGTPSGEGWSRLSDANPGAIGIVSEGGAEMRVDVGFNRIPLSENCSGGGLGLRCPTPSGALVGKLVGTRPKDWSFSCSGDTPEMFVSVGGHLVQVRG